MVNFEKQQKAKGIQIGQASIVGNAHSSWLGYFPIQKVLSRDSSGFALFYSGCVPDSGADCAFSKNHTPKSLVIYNFSPVLVFFRLTENNSLSAYYVPSFLIQELSRGCIVKKLTSIRYIRATTFRISETRIY